jgi:hypothetical protein
MELISKELVDRNCPKIGMSAGTIWLLLQIFSVRCNYIRRSANFREFNVLVKNIIYVGI